MGRKKKDNSIVTTEVKDSSEDLLAGTTHRKLRTSTRRNRNSPTHIYSATLKGTTKRYVGITTVPVKLRWCDHKSKSKNEKDKRHFYKAIRKYGFDAFDWEWIGTVENWAEGCEAEKSFVAKGLTHYNRTTGGEGTPGFRDAFLGKHHTEESKEKIRQAMLGKPRPQWVKDKMSAACMGRTPPNKGKKMAPEVGEKISKALKGKPGTFPKGTKFTPEHCAAISRGKKGKKTKPRGPAKPRTPEQIAETSAKIAATKARNKEEKLLRESMGHVITEVKLDG